MSLIQNNITVKLKAGNRMIPATITIDEDRIFVKFGFSKPLIEEIKQFESSKYHGYDKINPRKIWSIADTERNRFQLAYLIAPAKDDPENPYYLYNVPLLQPEIDRNVYNHQYDLICHGFTRHYCIMAAEMGTGKTLAAIIVMELSRLHDWIWVGPKSALTAVRLEFKKWKAKIQPSFVTYEGLKKLLADWPSGKKAPQGVIYDEASRVKNPTAQRTQAARYLADQIRKEWGKTGFVIEMSGSPAPKSPVDWWSLCEIARPGFLREGSPDKLKKRVAIVETRELFAGGGVYPHLVTWKDDEKKCNICGLYKEAETHSDGVDVFAPVATCHKFEPSVNEVHLLYRRMSGLVMVKFKKDCLDLPDKVYREIQLTPTQSMQNAAQTIKAIASSTIKGLTLLRELSDGFQYIETVVGTEVCPLCKGTKTTTIIDYDPEVLVEATKVGTEEVACPHCNATGIVEKKIRTASQIPTPKEAALKEILDEHDDIGRIVCYGGFTGSVDRVCSIMKSAGWNFIRVDGRGWLSDIPNLGPENLLELFQTPSIHFPRIGFVGQPSAAGMGLTLTASPTIVYYSNDFNAESRIQSEDRIHRPGMDINRGATIIDLLCLPSDKYVLDNLKRKRKLQEISMGEFKAALEYTFP